MFDDEMMDRVFGSMNDAEYDRVRAEMDALPADEREGFLKARIAKQQEGLPGVHIEGLQQMATFADTAVNLALAELVALAQEHGVSFVPVAAIEALIDAPKLATQLWWEAIEKLDVNVDYGVPDDLSGLDSL